MNVIECNLTRTPKIWGSHKELMTTFLKSQKNWQASLAPWFYIFVNLYRINTFYYHRQVILESVWKICTHVFLSRISLSLFLFWGESEIWSRKILFCLSMQQRPEHRNIRQYCRLNICSYICWIDKCCICQFNQYNYNHWDGSAVYET